jgi:ABC-2 type transport system ATP-binding protein
MNAIEVKNLSVQFGDFYAVKNISFHVKRGEIFGFLGANGAGKTTTIRVLCGLLSPSAGTVSVAGVDGFAIKSKVGYMSQKFTLYDDLSIEENLSFVASLRKLKRSDYLERRKKILDFISFHQPLTSLVKNLSGGIKQQISLAASILHDPEIVFLDEPTAGVTPAARVLFWNLLKQLASEKKTIFVSTHYMDEAEQCETIALMGAGEIIAMDSPQNLKSVSFPSGIYEMTPLKKTSFAEIQSLRKNPSFLFFEPYGLRFHACFTDSEESLRFQNELKQNFHIQKRHPSLEDVFIRLVEGQQR